VRTLARNEKTGPIVSVRCINEDDDIMLITLNGVVLRTRLNQIRETGRIAQGVKLMDLYDGDEVVGVAIMSAEVVNETSEDGDIPPETSAGASTDGASETNAEGNIPPDADAV